MRSERQALTDLLDRLVRHADGHWRGHEYEEGIEYAINEIREFLADVQPDIKPADPCQHMTKCADGACKYRMAAAEPAPAGGTIDRDTLVDIIEQALFEDGVALTSAHLAADRILARLRAAS